MMDLIVKKLGDEDTDPVDLGLPSQATNQSKDNDDEDSVASAEEELDLIDEEDDNRESGQTSTNKPAEVVAENDKATDGASKDEVAEEQKDGDVIDDGGIKDKMMNKIVGIMRLESEVEPSLVKPKQEEKDQIEKPKEAGQAAAKGTSSPRTGSGKRKKEPVQ